LTKDKAQRPQGPFYAVGSVVGERSCETWVETGGSGGSLSLTGRACQREMLPVWPATCGPHGVARE